MSNIMHRRSRYLGIYILLIATFIMSFSPLWAKTSQEIKISEQLILIDFDNENDMFAVRELYQFTNIDPGAGSGDLVINLPDGAMNIYVGKKDSSGLTETVELEPQKYSVQDSKVLISEQIASGENEFLLLFYTIENLQVKRTFNYPTDKLYVFAPLRFSFSSDKLHNLGMEVLDEAHYQAWGAESFNKGDSYLFKIGTAQNGEQVTKEYQSTIGLHSAAHLNRWNNPALSMINPHLWLFSLFALAMVMLTLIIMVQSKNQAKAPDNLENVSYLLAKQDRFLLRIKELDLKMDRGEIKEETYYELRKQYKELLVKVKLRLGRLGEG